MISVNYAIVESQGISSITDGRDFVIEGPGEGNFPLPTRDNQLYIPNIGGKYPETVLPVSEDSAFSCGDCGDLFDRSMIEHNVNWMYTAFSCTNHLLDTVYVDVFPKVSNGPSQSWGNAFMRLDTDCATDAVILAAMQAWKVEDKNWEREQASVRYLLTPAGIELTRAVTQQRVSSWQPNWLAQIINRNQSLTD